MTNISIGMMKFMGNVGNSLSEKRSSHYFELPVLRSPDWQYRSDDFFVQYEIVNGDVLHGVTAGKVKESDIEPAIELQESVINSTGLESKPYYYVLGFSGSSSASQKARKQYVKSILRVFKNYPFKLIVFYGPNRLLTAAINLAKPFVPFKVLVTTDWDTALKLITEERSSDMLSAGARPKSNSLQNDAEPKQIRFYAEELLGYIEQINWEVNGINQLEEKDPDHPFYRVFEALKLVKWELDDLYQQRESVEKALRKSETKFRQIIEASPMGMHMYRLEEDKRLVFTGANPAADAILGTDNGQFVGKTIQEAFPPLLETDIPDQYARVCDAGSQYRNEQIEYSDGKIKGAFEVHAFQTGPGMMTAMFFDVTARKQAETALRESEERYKTLTNNLHVGVYRNTVGPQGKFIEANPAIVEMFGYEDKEEFKALSVADLYQEPSDRKKFNEKILKDGLVKKYEVKLKKKDGTPFIGSVSAVAVKDVNGEVKYYDGIIEDITGKKELELHLQQAQKMEAIGTLAGGIAHDFNNILSAIIGYTELALIDANIDSPIYQNLQEVFRAGERAKDLVRQILTFSRQAERERKPVQLKLMTKEVIKFLRASLPTTIDIHQEIESDALVLADPTQIHQLLMNLCTNAGHAMREKGGVLTVKLVDAVFEGDVVAEYPELKAGTYVRLTVSDTGDGIPAHMLDRIFDPFFTTKNKGEGTGMGLSVVHGIVGSHGGKVIASSQPEMGSTFTVYLPTVERNNPLMPTEGDSVPTGSERILLVDDETVLVDIGRQMLESLGYSVTTRTSSIEALELFKAKADRFDLVITDMTMPNMTGDELAQELISIKPEIPIILCTGYSSRINQQRATALGIRAYVSKPVARREIAETIRGVLDESI